MAQKVALITGCSTGIGLSMALKLAKDAAKGYLVYPTMRNLEKRGQLEKEAGDTLNKTMFIRQLDVLKDESVSGAVEGILNEHGRIDVVINNAGIATFNPVEYSSMEDMKAIFDTNFFGTARVIQAVLPHMKQRRAGHIVNVSSIGGLLGYPFYEVYSASKHATEGLTESLAIRLKDFNIKLTTVVAGPVNSSINDNIVQGNRLPSKNIMDKVTRQQLKRLISHQKYHFEHEYQSSEEVAEIVQGLLEMDLDKVPSRIQTSKYCEDMTAMMYSEVSARTWVDYARHFITDYHESVRQSHQSASHKSKL